MFQSAQASERHDSFPRFCAREQALPAYHGKGDIAFDADDALTTFRKQ